MTAPFRNSLDIAKPPAATRVVAAMSGGVDSSVVAALLKREGYDVVGVTLQLYDHGAAVHRTGACCAGQDIHDARRVAETIGYPPSRFDKEMEETLRRGPYWFMLWVTEEHQLYRCAPLPQD